MKKIRCHSPVSMSSTASASTCTTVWLLSLSQTSAPTIPFLLRYSPSPVSRPSHVLFFAPGKLLPRPYPQSASSNHSDLGPPVSSSERPPLSFLYKVDCASPSLSCDPVLFPSWQLSLSELLTLPYVFVYLHIASLPVLVSYCCITKPP